MRFRPTVTQTLLAVVGLLLATLAAVETARLIAVRKLASTGSDTRLSPSGTPTARHGSLSAPVTGAAAVPPAGISSDDVWQQFEHMRQLQQQIDRFFESRFAKTTMGGWPADGSASSFRDPPSGGGQPFQQAAAIQKQIDAMFQRAFEGIDHFDVHPGFDWGWDALAVMPAMDLRDMASNYVVTVSLPGVRPGNIRITLEGPILTVIAEQVPMVRSSANADGSIDEIAYPGTFERRIHLPGAISEARQSRAAYEEGVLRITIPKANARELLEKRVPVM